MLCEKCKRFCAEISQRLRGDFNSSDAETEYLPFDTRINIETMISTSRWPSYEMELYESLQELKSADQRQCSICRCVSRCVEASELEQLPWGIFKTFLILTPNTGRPSLRMRLMHYKNGGPPTEVLTENVAIYNPSITKSPSLIATLSRCSELENDSTGSSSTFELAKYWLSECLDNHLDCPKPASGKLPTRLVDVVSLDSQESVRLVESTEILDDVLPSQQRYVALSHCWGKQQILTTTLATLRDRKIKIRMVDLSNTFRDAVTVTRRLGLRFLWIDSLCIIQDSADDWKNESTQMCAVYQGAVVTIAAAHASSGNGGCFVRRDGSALLPFSLPLRTQEGTETVNAFFLPLSVSRIVRDVLDEQPLLTRAWVLQEQVLSRALLLYHSDQLRWECHTTQKSERSPDGAYLLRAYDDLSRALVCEGDAFQRNAQKRLDGQVGQEKEEWDMHRQWCQLVADYTRRGITKTTDRLIALDGIAQTMTSRTSNRYVAGLWSDQLAFGLMWSIPWTTATSYGFWEQAKDPTLSLPCSRHETSVAPSWSWASVTFPVTWAFIDGNMPSLKKVKSLCNILNVDTEGTPFSMSGKLLIQGWTQKLLVDPTYQQYHFSGISKDSPRIKRLGILETSAADPDEVIDTCYASPNSGSSTKNFKLFPMRFTPDELIDRTQEITFLAIAEIPASEFSIRLESSMPTIKTLALIPTGVRHNEYRRVGIAQWYNCSWYGYFCVGERYSRSHWQELRYQKIIKGWRIAIKDFFNKCLSFLIGELLNQPVIQPPYEKLRWFSHLANGRWGRHRHTPNSHSFRKNWEAKWETITIV